MDAANFEDLPAVVRPFDPRARIRVGTSSWSAPEWAEGWYPRGMALRERLAWYARHFDVVEIDATWHALPRAGVCRRWHDHTPEGFAFHAKAPRDLVHGGTGRVPNGRMVLAPDGDELLDRFLDLLDRLAPKLEGVLLQFPWFPRQAFPSAGPFLDRLDAFLGRWPAEAPPAVVEVRNPSWIAAPLCDLLRGHGASLALSDVPWMPDPEALLPWVARTQGPCLYLRLLGRAPGHGPTRATAARTPDAQAALVTGWIDAVVAQHAHHDRVRIFVGPHLDAQAPHAAARVRERVAEGLALTP